MTDREAVDCLETHTSIACEYGSFPKLAEATRLAVSALQEREERSKGCIGCVHRLDVQVFEEPCLHCIRNAYELELRDSYAADR